MCLLVTANISWEMQHAEAFTEKTFSNLTKTYLAAKNHVQECQVQYVTIINNLYVRSITTIFVFKTIYVRPLDDSL